MSRTCFECAFFEKPAEGFTCGKCMYPVPGYIVLRLGNFLSLHGYEAIECLTYRNRVELAKQEVDNAIRESCS